MLNSFDKQLLFGINFGLNVGTLLLEHFIRSRKRLKRYKYEVHRLQRQHEQLSICSDRDWVLHSLNPVTETFGKRYINLPLPSLLKAEGPVHLLLMDVLVMLISPLHFQLSSVTF